jgi:hypothetical protein
VGSNMSFSGALVEVRDYLGQPQNKNVHFEEPGNKDCKRATEIPAWGGGGGGKRIVTRGVGNDPGGAPHSMVHNVQLSCLKNYCSLNSA